MIPDCISFNAIPHTTRIFSDFLSYSPEIRRFYPTQPDAVHIAAFAKSVPRDLARQARVADASGETESRLGSVGGDAAEYSAASRWRIRRGHGPAGGIVRRPAALVVERRRRCWRWRSRLKTLGVECVPVFWLATEDHDLAEVNQSLLLTPDFQLAPFTAETSGVAGSPVATIRFAEGTNDLVAQAGAVVRRIAGRRLSARELRRRRDIFQRLRQTLRSDI